MNIRNFEQKSLLEVQDKLASLGLPQLKPLTKPLDNLEEGDDE